MILSHNGVPEFGSPVRPMFVEAKILSALAKLEAQIFEFHSAKAQVEPGQFTDCLLYTSVNVYLLVYVKFR